MAKKLKDYSGPFKPNLKYEDFTKDTLVRLLKEYARAYNLHQGSWYNVMRERYGDKVTIECDIAQWMTTGPMVAKWLSEALNIAGGNVEAMFKALQVDPGFPLSTFDIEWELVNPNHGFFTVKKCTALNYFEKEGKGFEIPLCRDLEPPTFLKTAQYFNPKVKLTSIKLPPRKSPKEIACKWEYKID